jgi:tripartite-type tricarboxylate transporter receptor subunit TctC
MIVPGRRSLLTGLAAIAMASAARAQTSPWPARPIRMVIPFPPGGPTDIVARVLSDRMSRSLGQPIVVENRPGANGNIGNDAAAKAEPDGYTVLYNTSSIALSPAIYTKLIYDALRDLAPVVQTATIPMVLAVNPSVPAHDVKGFVEHLRARPNALSYGSSGTGNVTHLTATMILRSQGIEAVHVPYRGSAPALMDAIAGQVQFVTDTVNSALPLIRDGKLRALAVTSPKRLGLLPDVPTIAETIIPGFEAGAWQGIMVPARTPRPIIDRLNAVAMEALADPVVLAKLAEQGTEPLGSTPDEYGRILRAETERWGRVVAENGVRLE